MVKFFYFKDIESFLWVFVNKWIIYKWKRIILELVRNIKLKINGLMFRDK